MPSTERKKTAFCLSLVLVMGDDDTFIYTADTNNNKIDCHIKVPH
jgi:hypothetical protein